MIGTLLLALASGTVAGIGPCGLSRALAVRAIVSDVAPSKRTWFFASFAAGLVCGYVAFGIAAVGFGAALAASPIAYYMAAAMCAAMGVSTALRAVDDAAVCRRRCYPSGAGGTFWLGVIFTSFGSPCCGPLAAALAGTAATSLARESATAVLCAYALGHLTPIALFFSTGAAVRLNRNVGWRKAVDAIAGGVMIGLGGFYAAIA